MICFNSRISLFVRMRARLATAVSRRICRQENSVITED